MQINQEISVNIQARLHWNDTGIDLYEGQSYLLRASGQWHDSKDQAGPCRYKSRNAAQRLTTWARRYGSADWFTLVDAIFKTP